MKKVILKVLVLGTLLGAGLGFAGPTSNDPTFPALNGTTINARF